MKFAETPTPTSNENLDMASAVKHSGQILMYQWKLKDLPSKFSVMTDMIEFLNMKTFRFGLKHEGGPLLYFVSTNLHKIGFQVVKVSIKTKPRSETIEYMHLCRQEPSVQLFTKELPESDLEEDLTIVFSIHLVETMEQYRYQLSDVLVKEQLWNAAKNKQWTDVEFAVKNHLYSAHKFVLAARSPVMASIFTRDKDDESRMGRIKIEDTEAAVFEDFLRFLYTGEFNVKANCQQLLTIAEKYQVATLKQLCQSASQDIEANLLTTFAIAMKPDFGTCPKKPRNELRGNGKSFFSFQKQFFVLKFTWRLEELPASLGLFATSELFSFQHQGIFRAGLANNPIRQTNLSRLSPEHFLYLACTQLHKTGIELDEVESFTDDSDQSPMDRRGEKSLQIFGQELYALTVPATFTFHIKIHETMDNYRYQLLDTQRGLQMWSACQNQLLTDIEFVVNDQTFRAHRAVVTARSLVLAATFYNCTSMESLSRRVKIEEVDASVFENFLFFIYTGTLQVSPSNPQLLKLSERFQVETLRQLCLMASKPVDVDEITTSLIWF